MYSKGSPGNPLQVKANLNANPNPQVENLTTKFIAFSVCLELEMLLSMAPTLQLVADLHSLLIS